MVDFAQMKRKVLAEKEYTFWNSVGQPTIKTRPAGEKNKAYFEAKLRHATEMQKRNIKEVTPDLIVDNRSRDRKLFARHVISGFGDNVVDVTGAKVPFNLDNAGAFLHAVDDDEFDAYREFCADMSNFYEIADAAAIAGNSQTV